MPAGEDGQTACPHEGPWRHHHAPAPLEGVIMKQAMRTAF